MSVIRNTITFLLKAINAIMAILSFSASVASAAFGILYGYEFMVQLVLLCLAFMFLCIAAFFIAKTQFVRALRKKAKKR